MSIKKNDLGQDETEEDLALRLKELCYVNGREKDPKLSATVFHKLALLYMKKQPDKISLIQSAALFNAAMIRDPENVLEVEEDLEILCSNALKAAGVKKDDANLLSAAKTCKNAVKQFRENTLINLQNIPFIPETVGKAKWVKKKKISKVREVQNVITENYLSIMSYLSDFCLSIMEHPPSHCRFALVGLGSLARKEITPYSDFEHVIVLEEGAQLKENYCEILEYFRWYSVIFQIILINIGETIIPSISIPSLNNFSTPNGDWFFDAFTPSGISFDGLMPYACKMPLGRQQSTKNKTGKTELIKPSSSMANYLDVDQKLKHGYHLAEVLSKTCFVSGDRHVYEDFSQRISRKMSLHRRDRKQFADDVRRQIQEDRLKFDVDTNCSDMYTTGRFNLKRVVYRSTTIFVSALGNFYGVESSSCFDILDCLHEMEIISSKERYCLQYAVAIACELRLKIYMKRQRQSDLIENRTLGSELTEILKVMGGRCIVDYFTIARAFQHAITSLPFEDDKQSRKINLFLDYKYSIDICCKLRLHKTCLQICTSLLQKDKESLSKEDRASCHYYAGISHLDLEQPRLAKKHFDKELHLRQKLNSNNKYIADCYYNLGRCLVAMSRFEQALEYFHQELSIRENLTSDKFKDPDVAFCIREIAWCLFNLKKVDDALENFHVVLKIWESIENSPSIAIRIVHCKRHIGLCLSTMQNYREAMEVFLDELECRKRISTDENSDGYVAECLKRVGSCLMNLERNEEAISRFEQALAIYERLIMTQSQSVEHAECVYCVNICKQMLEGSPPPIEFGLVSPITRTVSRPPRHVDKSSDSRESLSCLVS